MVNLPLGPLMVDVEGLFLCEDEKRFLCSPSVGAVILFSRNFETKQQVFELIKEIKALRSPALLIAVDQEGGRVQRFREGFYPLPPMQRFGDQFQHSPDTATSNCHVAGRLMASELANIGVDFSFAPVLDIANSESDVIGDRSFHQDPHIICQLAGAFINGMNSVGMAATGKHFPGHGGISGDSHFMKPVDLRSMETLQSCDLIPYRSLVKQLAGVMTAHVQFPEIDTELPTFSTFWINQILRTEIGFNGLVFSDDLSMKGAHEAGNPLERTESALGAGCDMALICNDPDSARLVAEQLNAAPPDQARLEGMRIQPVSLADEKEIAAMQKTLSEGFV